MQLGNEFASLGDDLSAAINYSQFGELLTIKKCNTLLNLFRGHIWSHS